jgi:hypothetical protein
MTTPRKRVQTINPPGSEVGPGATGAVATWGTATSSNWSNLHHNQINKIGGRGRWVNI